MVFAITITPMEVLRYAYVQQAIFGQVFLYFPVFVNYIDYCLSTNISYPFYGHYLLSQKTTKGDGVYK